LPLVRGHKVTTSPLPMKPVAAERNHEMRRLVQREPAGEGV
jgi:two-component system sensor histidine kinase MtrB